MSTNPVVHFEMPYEDAKRVAAFYAQAFGWNMHGMSPDQMDYVVAETGETKDGRPTQPGTINGGFYAKAASAAQYPSVVIYVEDVDEAIEKITQAGGTVLGEPMDIPSVGRYVSFTDTEGNRVSILQPRM